MAGKVCVEANADQNLGRTLKKLRILPYNGAVALHDDVVRSVLWHCGYEFAVYKNATRLGKASNGIGTNISVLTL